MTDNDMQQFQFDKIGKKNAVQRAGRVLPGLGINTHPNHSRKSGRNFARGQNGSLTQPLVMGDENHPLGSRRRGNHIEHYGIVTARQRTRTPIVGTGIQQSERNRPGIYNRHIPE